jgi:hypothetical protein
MALKHTPSPWIHDHSEIIDGRGLRVCRFADYGAPSPEDMSVILAAPAMLRLLRVVCDQRNTWEELIAAIDEGRGVIARLDGDT